MNNTTEDLKDINTGIRVSKQISQNREKWKTIIQPHREET